MSIKINRAFDKAGIPANREMTRRHILRNLSKVGANLDKLTSTEISYIIKALDIGYHDGRADCQAAVEDDCLWIAADVQKLIPLKNIKDNINLLTEQ